MKVGDMLYPLPAHRLGAQLHIPFWGNEPALIVGLEEYNSTDPNDCQSEELDDMRWLVLESGQILMMTTFLIEQLYECR